MDTIIKIHQLDQSVTDLCAVFISANGVRPEFSYPSAQALLDAKLIGLDPRSELIRYAAEDALCSSLMSNEYPRGEYVARLVAKRITKAFEQINHQGGSAFLIKLMNSNCQEVSSLLMPLYGVGPKFVETYCLLAGIEKDSE